MEQKFSVNQIVKGKVAGHFVVLGYRPNAFGDRMLVQVKPYDPKTGAVSRGEMAFEEDSLVAAVSFGLQSEGMVVLAVHNE